MGFYPWACFVTNHLKMRTFRKDRNVTTCPAATSTPQPRTYEERREKSMNSGTMWSPPMPGWWVLGGGGCFLGGSYTQHVTCPTDLCPLPCSENFRSSHSPVGWRSPPPVSLSASTPPSSFHCIWKQFIILKPPPLILIHPCKARRATLLSVSPSFCAAVLFKKPQKRHWVTDWLSSAVSKSFPAFLYVHHLSSW